MAILVTSDQKIQNLPANTPVIRGVGDVITSDRFQRDGALNGSTTDNFAGGAAKVWGGLVDGGNATVTKNVFQVSGFPEKGYADVLPVGAFSLCLDAGRYNATVSFRLLPGSSANVAGNNSMIELRKAAANTGDTYRITLGPYVNNEYTGCTLSKRVSGSAAVLSNLPNIPGNAFVKVDMKDGVIKIYYNEILQHTRTELDFLKGNFFGIAGSSSNKQWRITDFILRMN